MKKKSKLKNVMFWTGSFLLMAGFVLTPMPGTVGAQEQEEEFILEDVVVTSTRRAELITDVPLSVTAFSVGQMEAQGLKQIDDLIPFTPGLVITRGREGGVSGNDISIRGIASNFAGTATTGIYIDDTPVQVRNLSYGSGTTFPVLFDLERVEVLRGPQGTLFGAGSEGGTVRFIQTVPSMDKYSSYLRAEYSSTKEGDPSYEFGAAFGGPIIDGKLGFRVSAYYREDGGFVDGIQGTPVVLDPTGDAGPNSMRFTDVTVTHPDMNSITTKGFRAALKWAPTDSLEITPSFTHQRIEFDDSLNQFWPAASSGSDYARPVFVAGDPATNPELTEYPYTDTSSGKDSFFLPALAINWDLGAFEIFSNTSYFKRDYADHGDFTGLYTWYFDFPDPTNGWYARPGHKGGPQSDVTQENFVQEIRFQSTDNSSRLKWVAGLYYSHLDQTDFQYSAANMLEKASPFGFFYFPPSLRAVDDGFPFGPGSTAFENWFGLLPDVPGREYASYATATDTQLAAFAQVDYDITEDLTLTAGLRVSRIELDYHMFYSGPSNNVNGPQAGLNPIWDPSLGPVWTSVVVENKETTTTPKIGLSYDINEDNMIYLNVAKGFRPGGGTQRLPVVLCRGQLIRYGYVDENGEPSQPTTYDSDYVWSYEVGIKNILFDNRLSIDASVYVIDWTDIQSQIYLLNCGSFSTNLGEARSKGFDLGFQLFPIHSLLITGTVGYNKTEFSKDAFSPGGVLIYSDGSIVPGSPVPWRYSLSAHHEFSLFNGQPFYWHADITHSSEARRINLTDPSSINYNPDIWPAESYTQVNARIGAMWGKLDISLFAKNLFNADPSLNPENNNIYLFGAGRRYVWGDWTLRPRTVGISISYRY